MAEPGVPSALQAGPPPSDPPAMGEQGPPSTAPPPLLARLLGGVRGRLGEGGGSAGRQRELRKAEAELSLRRRAWLRWEALNRGLGELCWDPQNLDPPVLQALEEALTLAQLRLGPPIFTELPPRTDPTPLLSRLLPALERRLGEKVAELGLYHNGGARPDPAGDPPGAPTKLEGVGGALASQWQRLEGGRRRGRVLKGLLEEQRRAYAQALGRCLALLGALWGEGRRGEGERRRGRFLEAKGVALLLKVRWEELQLLIDAYPPAKLAAHRRLRAWLEAGLEGAGLEAGLKGAELRAYEACGGALGALAQEFGRLRERGEQRRWALLHLRQQRPDP